MEDQEQNETPFNPNPHLIKIKSGWGDTAKESDYLPVQYRIRWFRDVCPHGTIETRIEHFDLEAEFEEEKFRWNKETRKSEKYIDRAKGIAVFHAVVTDGGGGVAHGTKMEKRVSFDDFLEKAESGAIGRALAGLGYGTQFTGDELNESHRIVDSPLMDGSEDPKVQKQQPPKTTKQPISSQSVSQDPAKLTLEEDKARTLLFLKHASQAEQKEFAEMIEVPAGDWKPVHYRKAAMNLHKYPATASMKEKFLSYSATFTTERLKAFQDRNLGKPLDELTAIGVAHALEDLENARFFSEVAKIFDPEHKELQIIGAKYANGTFPIEHPLDIFGNQKKSEMLNLYFSKLKTAVLANKDAVSKLPEDVREMHRDRIALLTTSKKSA